MIQRFLGPYFNGTLKKQHFEKSKKWSIFENFLEIDQLFDILCFGFFQKWHSKGSQKSSDDKNSSEMNEIERDMTRGSHWDTPRASRAHNNGILENIQKSITFWIFQNFMFLGYH